MRRFFRRLALSITVFFHFKPCIGNNFVILTLEEMGNLLRVVIDEEKSIDERKVEALNIISSAHSKRGRSFVFLDYMPE